ncbi:MAG: transcription termination factor NusA [Nitrospiraceae bacterium]|nr:transcription termination factor NusA [Nitrospiraceae bacterium]
MIDIDILRNIEREEHIPKDYVIEVVKVTLHTAYRKTFGEHNSEVKVNLSKGEVKLYAEKRIVEQVKNPVLEIGTVEAKKFTDDIEIGHAVLIEISLSSLSSTSIRVAKQIFQQKILEKKREIVFQEFSGKVGGIIVGKVTRRKSRGDIGVNIEPYNIEGVIPPEEAIPGEPLRRGKLVRAYIKEVKKLEKGPLVILSRACPEFLEKLLEMEVPEIQQEIVEIKGIVRAAGARAKVAVATKDVRVDPVGACIGTKGVRINAVSRAVNRERIDVIRYNSDPSIYIDNAMSPAKVESVEVIKGVKEANVHVSNKNYPTAMGSNGVNVMLASKLTGYSIHLIGQSEEGDANEQGK